MNLTLERYSYATTETEGDLHLEGYSFATLERPWIPWAVSGGKPFSSCVPDGVYLLEPFIRNNAEHVYSLRSEENGVFVTKEQADFAGGGRYACLLHSANFVYQVVGCIAPGMSRGLLNNRSSGAYERAVLNSAEAIRVIRGLLGNVETHQLTIRPKLGAGGIV
jgi:hypothetical protein